MLKGKTGLQKEKPLNRKKLSILTALAGIGLLTAFYIIAGLLPPTPLDYSDSEISYANEDLNDSYSNAGVISLNDSGITCEDPGVLIDAGSVKITKGGSYIITGSVSDGCIYIAADSGENVHIIFSGADITCSSSPPVYIEAADKVILTTAEGTINNITATKKGGLETAIYSTCDLTFNGAGTLNITSENGIGVNCETNVRFADGIINLSTKENSIKAAYSVSVRNGNINITSEDDGITTTASGQSNGRQVGAVVINGGEININSEGDAIDSGSVICVKGGIIDIVTAGGSSEQTQSTGFNMPGPENTGTNKSENSAKALKAKSGVCISGGSLSIDSADDGINSKNNVTITDGQVTILCNDDGITADSLINILGGTIDITQSVEGIEAHYIIVDDGIISVNSTDDGFNATAGSNPIAALGKLCETELFGTGGKLIINGGNICVTASGDGLDSNGSIIQTGGDVTVVVNGRGADSAIDYDGSYTSTGGTLEQNVNSSGPDSGSGPGFGSEPDFDSGHDQMPDEMSGGIHMDSMQTTVRNVVIGLVIFILIILVIVIFAAKRKRNLRTHK